MHELIGRLGALAATSLMLLTGCASLPGSGTKDDPLSNIDTIVVIYSENRAFDNVYGLFPGANGVANALNDPRRYEQLDLDGRTVLSKLPPAWKESKTHAWDAIGTLPNMPFRFDAAPVNSPIEKVAPDLVHRFYQHQMQINGGRNNMFAAYSDQGGLTMGHYDGSSLLMWKLAQQYTLVDNFFMGIFGGSFVNHQFLISAQPPRYENAPASLVSVLDDKGNLAIAPSSPASVTAGPVQFVRDGSITPDGYAVNTVQPPYQPSAAAAVPGQDVRLSNPNAEGGVLPPSSNTTIGDTLSARGISWKWYAGLWNEALKEGTTVTNGQYKVIYGNEPDKPSFDPHHQPFNYYKRFDPLTAGGAAERDAHLKDYEDLLVDITQDTLPQVVFYKPAGDVDAHPGHSDVASADIHVANLIAKLQASPQWKRMLIIVTYDENGGFWDHVAPPKGDRWGPGSRIPAIIISPFAKKGHVDHTMYDTTSILKLITRRFDLTPLPGVRPMVGDLTDALDFNQKP